MEDLVMNWELGTAGLLILAVSSVAVLLIMIMALKVHAFLALMITSIGTALVSGIAPGSIVDALAFGFHPTLGDVMLLVALGAMLGRMVEASGGAQVLADKMIATVGERRAGLGLSLASLLMGFPIFFDAGLVVMMPIIYAVARRLGSSFLAIALPSAVAFSAMHIFAPPHPGPVAASAIVGADIGLVMIVGIIFAVIIWFLAGVLIAPRLGVRFELPVPTILDSDKSESGFESSPRVGTIAALLLLPLVLILLNTGLNTIGNTRPDPEAFLADAWVAGLRMIGETPIALLITVVVSMFVLGWGAGKEGSLIEKVTDSAIGPIASVVLITGAGGMFGGVLRVTGIGDAVAGSLNDIGMPVIVAAYLIAQIVRLAQGSATVALTTAAALVAPGVINGGYGPIEVACFVMALAAGSVFAGHVNDSGFWLVGRLLDMDVKTTLKVWTVQQAIESVVAFALVLALYGVVSLF